MPLAVVQQILAVQHLEFIHVTHPCLLCSVDSKSWQEVSLSMAPSARAGHKCLLLPSDYEDHEEDEVIVFGGGDNDGSYFSDMLSFYIPF